MSFQEPETENKTHQWILKVVEEAGKEHGFCKSFKLFHQRVDSLGRNWLTHLIKVNMPNYMENDHCMYASLHEVQRGNAHCFCGLSVKKNPEPNHKEESDKLRKIYKIIDLRFQNRPWL